MHQNRAQNNTESRTSYTNYRGSVDPREPIVPTPMWIADSGGQFSTVTEGARGLVCSQRTSPHSLAISCRHVVKDASDDGTQLYCVTSDTLCRYARRSQFSFVVGSILSPRGRQDDMPPLIVAANSE